MRAVTPFFLVLFAACAESSVDGSYPDASPAGATSGPSTAVEPEEDPTEEPPACDAENPVTLYVSPDDSNSMSSPVQARTAVLTEGGFSLGNISLRSWEFLNYYSWSYPAAEPGELAVDLQLTRGDQEDKYTLQVGITSESPESRAPMNVTFVVDASGSMAGTPLQLAKEVMHTVSSQLIDGDVVSLVTWDTANNVLLDGHFVGGPADPVLASAIDEIASGGATDLANGLRAGYDLAEQSFDTTRINRLMLISDGGANVGQTDEEIIGRHAGTEDIDGIYLVGVGVGTPTTYQDVLMDTVTDIGRGASVFIPSKDEAQRMFADRFLETMGVAARSVQVRYDLPPGFEVVRFSGEEISTNPDEVRRQHVAPDDSVVLHQGLKSCAGAAPDDAEMTVTLEWKDAITFEAREAQRTATVGELLAADHALLAKGAAVFAYAEALKTAAGWDGLASVPLARELWTEADELNPGDPDLAEIREVLDAL